MAGTHALNGPLRPAWEQLFRSTSPDAIHYPAKSAQPVAAGLAQSMVGKGFGLSGHEIIKVDVDLSAMRVWLLEQERDGLAETSPELRQEALAEIDRELQKIRLRDERLAETLAARRQELRKSRLEWHEPKMGIEFVWVAAGCYQMGDTFRVAFTNEKPVHEVCVDGYYMGKYETTQAQWQRIMGSNPSYFKKEGEYPVETVSWNDVQGFIAKFRADSDVNYRLPTEAEWEFAARSGGKNEKYAGGAEVGALAWSGENVKSGPHRGGTKGPNGLGLYDMSGNLWEWCRDWYDENYYKGSPRDNPAGPIAGKVRVIRGGAWSDSSVFVRTTARSWNRVDDAPYNVGFRLVISPVI